MDVVQLRHIPGASHTAERRARKLSGRARGPRKRGANDKEARRRKHGEAGASRRGKRMGRCAAPVLRVRSHHGKQEQDHPEGARPIRRSQLNLRSLQAIRREHQRGATAAAPQRGDNDQLPRKAKRQGGISREEQMEEEKANPSHKAEKGHRNQAFQTACPAPGAAGHRQRRMGLA